MSELNISKEFGLGEGEAMSLLLKILREEGFNEDNIQGLFVLVSDGIQGKRTVQDKEIFARKLKEIIQEYKEELKNNDYFDSCKKILRLFCNVRKSRMHKYIENRYIIISTILMSMGIVSYP